MPAIAAAGVLSAVVIAGFSGGGGASGNPGAVKNIGTVPASTGGVVVQTDPVPKTTLTKTLKVGMSGPEVKAAQVRLKAMGFDPGPLDGTFGPGTQQAIWAFEGLVMKRPYAQQIGKLDNNLWQLMQDPIVFSPRRTDPKAGATHMEIYLDTQSAILFKDNKSELITHISSGTGQVWCDIVKYDTDNKGNPLNPPLEKDVCGVSTTPGGKFQFYRRYPGDRQGPLGGMWNPIYFNYGIAVHGAHNVPNAPASHGCIRIPMFIANYFPQLVAKGDLVYVWDGIKEPEQQSLQDMTPVFNYDNPNPSSTTTSTTTSTTVKPVVTPKPTTPTTTTPTAPPADTTITTASTPTP